MMRALAPTGQPHRVDLLLESAIADATRRAAVHGPGYALLWQEIGRSVHGGKRFRSGLVLGVHAGLGDPNPDAAVAVAAAFELLHTAFLVHDDLIDGDTVRRGAPNLAETMRRDALRAGAGGEEADRYAQAAAVLAGDLALAQAHRLLAGVDVGRGTRLALLDLFDETLHVSAGGELEDTAAGLGLITPSVDRAVRIAESKTAMYSFRAPLRAGALLAGADGGLVAELDQQGRLLGRAFQLVDDLLGVFAPEAETGKSNVSDLREGKRTPLILHARTTSAWGDLADGLGRPDLDDLTAARMRRALARCPAPVLVQRAVERDLADVRDRCSRLPDAVAHVVAVVGLQIAEALCTVVGHIDSARREPLWQAG
ncbi:polyprenyl synthetase family protein [Isoptericola sp. b441]|uniref:Polyprenyl synthetase family protein n=1 Tax=Actinotalea lenta TaxID=3064654 RepID=A0ABT9D7T6_9CELL|nr:MULTISPECIES: polyprenyl synthetase family protein [unclassified Isoptericola]MDO8106299.1 polyprenyl synthetase family protein [Isoptericola sp. b441]MDO8121981.1 polyprenyl synthetase family protein [Isoptericola sp. b490]